MKSEWKADKDISTGKPLYKVYRLRDTEKPDHSGNRQELPHVFEYRWMAEEMARILNETEEYVRRNT